MVERRVISEREVLKKPTEAQKLASQIGFFLDLAATAKAAAKEYVNEAGLKKREIKNVSEAFTDLYLIRVNGLSISSEAFSEKWGERANEYAALVDGKEQELQQKKIAATENAWQLTTRKRTAILAKASLKLKGLSDTQRQSLLEITGYTKEEGKYIRGKLLKSSLGTAAVLVSPNVAIGAVAAHETISPTIDYGMITDPKMVAALGISYVTHYASMALSSYTNRRLLEHPTINNCPNAFSTGLYFLVNKVNPESTSATRRAASLVNFLPAVIQEPAILPTAITLPAFGIVRNTGGTIFNLSLAGSNLTYEMGVNWRNRRNRRIIKE